MRHFLFSILLLTGLVCTAQTDSKTPDRHRDRHEHTDKGHHEHPAYFIIDGKVFYLGQEVVGASASSFKIQKDGYAKDTWNVYYRGVKIDGASSNSFKVFRDGYAKDTWNVLYDGEKIDGASSNSFKVLRDGYAKDTWNVYYRGQKV